MKCDKCKKGYGDFHGRGKTKEKVTLWLYRKKSTGKMETRCQRHL